MLLIVRWGNMQLNMAFERFTKQLKSVYGPDHIDVSLKLVVLVNKR